MNVKKWIIASVVVFIVSQILDFIVHGVLLTGAYQAAPDLWRTEAEMNQMMWLMWLVALIWSFLLVYIFAKGYEGKGIGEGVRFGIIIGLFATVPMSFGTYSVMPLTFSLALSWFIYGMIEYIILGIVIALLYKPAAAAAPAA